MINFVVGSGSLFQSDQQGVVQALLVPDTSRLEVEVFLAAFQSESYFFVDETSNPSLALVIFVDFFFDSDPF